MVHGEKLKTLQNEDWEETSVLMKFEKSIGASALWFYKSLADYIHTSENSKAIVSVEEKGNNFRETSKPERMAVCSKL